MADLSPWSNNIWDMADLSSLLRGYTSQDKNYCLRYHHNLTSVFSNGGLYKKAYGNEDNQKKTVEQT